MARGRKSKPRITYDSKDTKTLFGLVFLALGAMVLFSLFLSGPVFKFFRDIFSNEFCTICFALFNFNLALAIFKIKFPTATWKSIFGQALFLVALAAFLNSIWGANKLVPGMPVNYGGLVGLNVYGFLSERLFLNFTPVVLIIAIMLAIPFMLSMTVTKALEYLGGFFLAIYNLVRKLLGKKNAEAEVAEQAPADLDEFEPETVGQMAGRGKLLRFPVGAKPTMPQEEKVVKGDPMVSGFNRKNGMPGSQGQQKIIVADSAEDSKGGAYVNEQLRYPDWKLPPLDLLNPYKKHKHSQANISHNADVIEKTLESFGIRAKVVDVLIGPSVTQYALDLPLGIKVSKIVNLAKDIALSLAIPANAIRLETPIAGTTYIGIEAPNEDRETVYLKEAMSDSQLHDGKYNLPATLGKDIHGNMVMIDLQKMPHILIAGATGSGKSILTNGFIVSLLMTRTPDEVKFIMVDPKQVELSDYNGIPHLLTPVITEMDKVLNALKWAIAEMESRYTMFRESHVKNIEAYNLLMGYIALPYIVIVIDEMADMMMSTNRVETESAIVRLAQKARATGIHLVLATQRPSVDVITGLIKANIPGRIGMSVTTNIDSRVILDQIGAESLLGKGDLLFKDPSKNKPFRIQGVWVSPEEVQKVVQYIKDQVPEVTYTTKVTEFKDKKEEAAAAAAAGGGEGGENSSDDQDMMDAIRVIVNSQKGSSSLLQRKLRFGYNKAARIIDELEEYGLVGPANGSKPRDVYTQDAEGFIAKLFNNGAQENSADADIDIALQNGGANKVPMHDDGIPMGDDDNIQ